MVEAKKISAEIEITPAMLKAGVMAFLQYDSRFEKPEDAVEEIFEVMVEAMGADSPLSVRKG